MAARGPVAARPRVAAAGIAASADGSSFEALFAPSSSAGASPGVEAIRGLVPDRRDEFGHVRALRGWEGMKDERARRIVGEHTIDRQGVEVDVDVQGGAAALDRRDHATAAAGDAERRRPAPERPGQGAHRNGEDGTAERVIECHEVAAGAGR